MSFLPWPVTPVEELFCVRNMSPPSPVMGEDWGSWQSTRPKTEQKFENIKSFAPLLALVGVNAEYKKLVCWIFFVPVKKTWRI